MPRPTKEFPIVKKHRKLLLDWLVSARVNNRVDSGMYYGMTRRDTTEIDHLLDDLIKFCHDD